MCTLVKEFLFLVITKWVLIGAGTYNLATTLYSLHPTVSPKMLISVALTGLASCWSMWCLSVLAFVSRFDFQRPLWLALPCRSWLGRTTSKAVTTQLVVVTSSRTSLVWPKLLTINSDTQTTFMNCLLMVKEPTSMLEFWNRIAAIPPIRKSTRIGKNIYSITYCFSKLFPILGKAYQEWKYIMWYWQCNKNSQNNSSISFLIAAFRFCNG